MSLVNDGPGDIYFITAQSKDLFNTQEIVLHPNDLRELYNVYEIRSRTTLPLTGFRLVEGIIRTGSSAPFTKTNVEIRPIYQLNEKLKIFVLTFDNQVPTITITSPTIQTLVADYTDDWWDSYSVYFIGPEELEEGDYNIEITSKEFDIEDKIKTLRALVEFSVVDS